MIARVHVAGVQTVTAGLDELQGNLGAFGQIPLVILGIGRQGSQGGVACMVLPVSAFEQEDAGLQGHGRPLGHLIGALGGGEVPNGKVQVFDHLLHDQLTAVAGLVEQLGVRGADGFVIPRDVAEALDLGEIEVGAEETGEGRIFDTDLLVRAVADVLQQGVDIAEGRPAPAAAAGRNGALAHALVGHVVLGEVVVVGHIQLRGGEQFIEADGVGLELTLALEERVGGKPVLGDGVQQVVAAGESESGQEHQYGNDYLFHSGIH